MREPANFLGVMVSSTFTDLAEHRRVLIELIQSHKLLPIEMEYQGGARGDLDVLDSSLEKVSESAAYICIIGHRYGQIPPSETRNPQGLSLTELEFNEALELRRPILLFLMDDEHPVTRKDVKQDPLRLEKLEQFRQRAKLAKNGDGVERVYEEFSSLEDFSRKAGVAVPRLKIFLESQRAESGTTPRKTRVPTTVWLPVLAAIAGLAWALLRFPGTHPEAAYKPTIVQVFGPGIEIIHESFVVTPQDARALSSAAPGQRAQRLRDFMQRAASQQPAVPAEPISAEGAARLLGVLDDHQVRPSRWPEVLGDQTRYYLEAEAQLATVQMTGAAPEDQMDRVMGALQLGDFDGADGMLANLLSEVTGQAAQRLSAARASLAWARLDFGPVQPPAGVSAPSLASATPPPEPAATHSADRSSSAAILSSPSLPGTPGYVREPPTYGRGFRYMVVAAAAYEQLTPAARTRIKALLRLNPSYNDWISTSPDSKDEDETVFLLAATWPEDVKADLGYRFEGEHPKDLASATANLGYVDHWQHRYWHFIEMPFSTDHTPLIEPQAPNLLTQITIFRKTLASSASEDVKSYDLVWLENLVTDAHQPLHVTSRFTATQPKGDQNGNYVSLCDKPHCRQTLHNVRDGLLGESRTPESAVKYSRKLPAVDAREAAIDDPAVWVKESFELARKAVYVAPIGDGAGPYQVDAPYRTAARLLAQQQAALAGARLARLLNSALN